MSAKLKNDPCNVIITGVGGQGNVLASRMTGAMLTRQGLTVTIGETFGASQRGGSVMSHLRVSEKGIWSPQIPHGRADVVVSLEPSEALRVLKEYGNAETIAICNARPIHPVGVISGQQNYPAGDDLRKWVAEQTLRSWFIPATDEALELGNPIFGNIMMIGALAASGVLPLDRGDFKAVLGQAMKPDKIDINLQAYDMGAAMLEA